MQKSHIAISANRSVQILHGNRILARHLVKNSPDSRTSIITPHDSMHCLYMATKCGVGDARWGRVGENQDNI